MRVRLLNDAKGKDKEARVYNKISVPSLTKEMVGYITDQHSIVKFYQSLPGKILWFICYILGYQTVYETFWRTQIATIGYDTRKSIAGEKSTYRCDYLAYDQQAAESCFRLETSTELNRSLPIENVQYAQSSVQSNENPSASVSDNLLNDS